MSETAAIPSANPRTFALTGCLRVCQGLTAAILILRGAATVTASEDWLFPPLIAAALVCGMAAGTLTDALLVGKGIRFSIVTSAVSLLLGALAGIPDEAGFLVVAGLLTGIGSAGDGSLTAIAVGSLPNARRWRGMRIWTSLFAVGLICGVCLFSVPFSQFVPAALAAGLTIMAAIQLPSEPLNCHEHASCTVPPTTESCENESPDDCDETECCGGGARKFVRPSFLNGVFLAFGAAALIWGPIRTLIEAGGAAGSLTPALAVSIGLATGTWLVISAAPATGYAIVCLPFLLGVAVVCPLTGLLEVGPVATFFLCLGTGVCCGGGATALSLIVGELYSGDCSDEGLSPELSQCNGIQELGTHTEVLQLARIRMVGLFLATAVLLGFDLLRTAVTFPQQLVAFEASLAIVAILAVRAVPVPVVSSLGQDEDNGQHDDELQDVLAAMEQPVQ